MKSKRAISIIALIITIIVIIILALIVTLPGFEGIKNTENARIATEKRDITNAIIKRFGENARNEAKYPILGEYITEEELSDKIAEILLKENPNIRVEIVTETISTLVEHIDYVRKVDNVTMQRLEVEDMSPKNKYIVDYYGGNVFGPII